MPEKKSFADDLISLALNKTAVSQVRADVLDELNAPLVVPVKPLENKLEDLPMVATSVEPAVIKPAQVAAVAAKPAPLVVPKPVFVQPESKKPASYGETRPLKSVDNNEAKNKEIAQLRALATNYPEGSLERRVIEDEIVKVENK